MSLGGVDAYALLLYFAAIHTMTPHATTKATKTAASAGSGIISFVNCYRYAKTLFATPTLTPTNHPKLSRLPFLK